MSAKNTPIKTVASYFQNKPPRFFFAILWVVFVYQIIISGFEPNPYDIKVLDASMPLSYPIGLVVILVIAMFFHLSFLVTIDVYMRSQWKFFTMLSMTTLFLFFFDIINLHTPPLSWIIIWSFLSFLLFLVICFCQACLFFYVLYSVNHSYEDKNFYTN